jgi:hypothetical protein
MSLAPFRHRRRRARAAALVFVAMLLQQVALIAYACPRTEMPNAPQVEMADCERMAMPDVHARALCDEHCHPQHSAIPDSRLMCAPPALTQLYFRFATALLPPAAERHYEDVPTCSSDPPPAERFCSLQI